MTEHEGSRVEPLEILDALTRVDSASLNINLLLNVLQSIAISYFSLSLSFLSFSENTIEFLCTLVHTVPYLQT